jgi:CRP-like cAMP-binding protein
MRYQMNPFITFLTNHIHLTEIEMEALENALETKLFNEDDLLLKEKSVCKHITFLVSGKARSFFIDADGKEYTWSLHFNDGNSKFQNYFLLDYYSFLSQTPSHLTIQAVEDLEVIRLSYDNLIELTSYSPKMATLNSRMSEMAYQQVHRRAFSLLTMNAKDRYNQLLAEEPYLLHTFKHYIVASYLGIAPQSLSRLRNEIAT